MTQLFGCICNQAKRVSQAIEPIRDALVVSGPVARWGLGYVQAGQVLLSRNPRPEPGGIDFAGSIDGLTSDYIVGWAGSDDGMRGTPNTQPFRFRTWLYAQSGMGPSRGPGDSILEQMPGYLQRSIRGKTAAEVHFHLFLALLHDAGKIDDPDVDPDVIRLALRDTVAMVAKSTDGSAEAAFGNIVISNSRSMLAAHLDGQPMFMRHLRNDDPKLSANQRYRAVLAVTAPEKPGDGFEAIPTGSVLTIDRQVQAEITPLKS